MRHLKDVAVRALIAALLGCSGSVSVRDDAHGPGGAGSTRPVTRPANTGAVGEAGGPPNSFAMIDCEAEPVDPGPSSLQLLSREQYLNTLRDLFGDVPALRDALGPQSEASSFGLVQPDVTQVQLESFQAAAELIAARVVHSPDLLRSIAPCPAGSAQRDCARAMIERFGARMYRAAVDDPDDIERHLALFGAAADTSYEHGIELLLRGMLQSPRFLYRVELGTDERVGERAVALSGSELAARLSYLVWGTLPDAALNEAAATGSLATPQGVAEQLVRMLEDPRGGTLLRRFLESWVNVSAVEGLVKNSKLFPEWDDPALREGMRDQARMFFDHVLGAERGRLRALFTSRTVFVNRALGDFYGVASADEFEPLERADGSASGLLTLPAVLARLAKPDESAPIYRGKFVRETLLCQQLPAPPANVPRPPAVEAGVSTRERSAQHEVDPGCSGCHRMLDPIGFGFEHYDAIGRYRDKDGGKPVDARGQIVASLDLDGPFEGVVELGAKLAGSSEVEQCVARQWFRYAISRFEQDFDACSMQKLLAAFRAADQDLNTLPRALVATDAFRYRRPIDAEESP